MLSNTFTGWEEAYVVLLSGAPLPGDARIMTYNAAYALLCWVSRMPEGEA